LLPSGVPALSAISDTVGPAAIEIPPSLQALGEILFLSAGIKKRKVYVGGEIAFRAAACTGALYHIDLYLVCGELPGSNLEAGVYQFSPQDFSLRRLRKGDYRSVLVCASAQEPSIALAPAAIICASTYWRNSWKYRARTYRHCYWDNGTILANLLAAAAAHQLTSRVNTGFVDSEVSRLIGLDTEREAALTIVALGKGPAVVPMPVLSTAVESITLETEPLSDRQIDHPALRAMHAASSLESEGEVKAWRSAAQPLAEREDEPGTTGLLFPLNPLTDEEIPQDTIEQVILRRGSTREFARESITFEQLSTMLDRSTRGIPVDFLTPSAEPLNDLYLIVNAVENLPSGAYFFRRKSRALELLKEGDFRDEAGDLGLGQDLPADCSVDVFFLTDLARVLARYGNRGYRAAQLEAGVIGGKLYLSAYAQRLGASGLTFFDDDVTEFFSPHAASKSVMFLMALGKPTKRTRRLSIL
ncbi:MAG: SagB/ThcOx family dehydrogenase, partial [Blastocatellia bacterium]